MSDRPSRHSMVMRPDKPNALSRLGRWLSRHPVTASGATLAMIAVAGVITMTLLYDSERSQSANYEHQASEQAAPSDVPVQCIDLAAPEDFADCIASQVKASEEQKRNQRDLHAQQEMARWTFGLFWTGVVALGVSTLGLGALFYTFREQRKLTQNESCAYVEIIKAELLPSLEFGLTYRLYLRNTGKTPARNLNAVIEYCFEKEMLEGPKQEVETGSFYLHRAELAAESEGYVQATIGDLLDLPGLDREMGRYYERYGVIVEEDGSTSRPAKLSFNGQFSYEDVYGRTHTHLHIKQYTHSLRVGIFGTGTESLHGIFD